MVKFVFRNKKLGHTIKKRSMPLMDYKPNHSYLLAPIQVTTKLIAEAQRGIDIAKERGWSSSKIYSFDHLPNTPLFDGELPKKVLSKSQLVSELESKAELCKEDKVKPMGKISIMLDFMSRIRSSSNISKTCKTFGSLLKWGLSIIEEYEVESSHIIFDSYIEASLKSAERLRRSRGIEIIEYEKGELSIDLPLPEDMGKFWPSSQNRMNLQILIKDLVAKYLLMNQNVVIIFCIEED